jgi:hypothetical protein
MKYTGGIWKCKQWITKKIIKKRLKPDIALFTIDRGFFARGIAAVRNEDGRFAAILVPLKRKARPARSAGRAQNIQ